MTINFRQKKILITGGSGMVGRNFIENKLSKNYHLIAPTKKELNLLEFEKVNSFISKIKLILLFILQEK